MNDTQKPRNRIRLTSAEQKIERDKFNTELNKLTDKLVFAYIGMVFTLCVGLIAGAAFL